MKSLCVIGSINMDIILRVEEFPKAGQSMYASTVMEACGGKGANAAIAAAKLGVNTIFYGCVGQDIRADQLLGNLQTYGIDTKNVTRKPVPTGMAYIMVEQSGENRIIVAPGANEAMTAQDIRTVAAPLLEQADLVLIQLEIAPPCIAEIIKLCKENKKRLIIDAGPVRGITAQKLAGAFCISPNETELEALLNEPITTMEEVEKGARRLLATGAQQVLVKMGAKGSLFVSEQEQFFFPAYPVNAVDTTAAGDSFMAGYCAALLAEKTPRQAVEYATKCGAIAVTRMGATPSLPSREDVEKFEEFIEQSQLKC